MEAGGRRLQHPSGSSLQPRGHGRAPGNVRGERALRSRVDARSMLGNAGTSLMAVKDRS